MDDIRTFPTVTPDAETVTLAPLQYRRTFVIAVDGPAASGKGTLGQQIATRLNFAHLDTGMLYRAVGLKVLKAGGNPSQESLAVKAAQDLHPENTAVLEDPELRSDKAGEAASQVAVFPAVRQALLEFQRHFAYMPPTGTGGAVLDGRDIGTIICPDADAKLFVTASVEVRAERRLRELHRRGIMAIYDTVLADMKNRDERDSHRATAPLRPAPDAYILDTSALDPDEAFDIALAFIQSKIGNFPA